MESICLRFATACGWSPNLRLDLVLNDFVASALFKGNIEILSDGSPLRPLIDVRDMAKAMNWATTYKTYKKNLILNTGCKEWNFTVLDLAKKVKNLLPNIEININSNAQPDKRSYAVDFSKFKSISNAYPRREIEETIDFLIKNIKKLSPDKNFRNGKFMRLNTLNNLIKNDYLDKDLYWIS